MGDRTAAPQASGAGGSGVVYLRYLSTNGLINVGGGLTSTNNTTTFAGYRTYIFTAGTGNIFFY
jgi:hypothetical protein